MGKAPADQFYWQDWVRDLDEHPLEIEGAWIRINCKLWYSETRGKLTKSIGRWANILRISNEDTERILRYIKDEKIGDVTFCKEKVTVKCRRMYRVWKEKENSRLRMQRYREKHKSDGDVTPLSSSSEITSSSENTSTTKIKEVRHRYGEYNHVLLTDKQLKKLKTDYGEEATLAAIKKVDEWCEETGNRRQNYNLTLRKWGFESGEDGIPTQKPQPEKWIIQKDKCFGPCGEPGCKGSYYHYYSLPKGKTKIECDQCGHKYENLQAEENEKIINKKGG